jgi:hypothetical protein
MKKFTILILLLITSGAMLAQRDYNAPHIVTDGINIVKGDAVESPKASLFESFEGAFLPDGWVKVNPDGGSGWAQIADATSPLPGWQGGTMTVPPSGGSYAAYCTWNTGGSSSNDQWLITPPLDIVDGDVLSFWLYYYSSYTDYMELLLSTTDDDISSFNVTLDTWDFSSTTDWTEYTYDLSDYDGQTVYIAFRETVADNFNDGGFTAIDLVQIGTLESVDLTLTSINTPTYAAVGNVDITGSISNNGGDNISSFDVTYNIDGGTESAVYQETGIDIPLGGSYDFTHDVPFNFDSDGTYNITVTISNVNGGGENNLEDNTLSKDIIIYSGSAQRKVVLENFTTGSCPNCPPIHTLLEDYIAGEPNAILIAQHAGYYTDEMTIPENTELLIFYNDGGSTYAPALMIDRYHYETGLTGGSPDPGPVFWPGESTTATTDRIDERLTVPAFAEISINGTYSSTTKGTLELDISGELIGDVSGDDLRLVIYIKEDGLIYNQSGGSADYEHNNVLRDAISGTFGDEDIVMCNSNGTAFTKHYSYTVDEAWVEDNLSLVAFIANYDSDVNNMEILNAQEVKLTDLLTASPNVYFSSSDCSMELGSEANVIISFASPMRLVNDADITDGDIADFITFTDPSKGDIPFTGTINADKNQITLDPDNNLPESTTVTVTVLGGMIENQNDEAMTENYAEFTTQGPSGISEQFSNVNVYPNPAYNTLFISDAQNSTITVFDLYGKLVYSKEIMSNLEQINITELSSGMYIIRLINENNVSEMKVNIVK